MSKDEALDQKALEAARIAANEFFKNGDTIAEIEITDGHVVVPASVATGLLSAAITAYLAALSRPSGADAFTTGQRCEMRRTCIDAKYCVGHCKAAPPLPAPVAAPDLVPVAYTHPMKAIWRVDNCPAGIDFTKDGWIALYPADALATLSANLDAMRRERDEWRGSATEFRGLCSEWQASADAAEAEVARLKALASAGAGDGWRPEDLPSHPEDFRYAALLRHHDYKRSRWIVVPEGQSLDFDEGRATREWLRPHLGTEWHLFGFVSLATPAAPLNEEVKPG